MAADRPAARTRRSGRRVAASRGAGTARPRQRARSGFTLFELIVAILILGGLTAVLLPQVLGRLTEGEAAALSRNLKAVSDAVLAYRGDVGVYPGKLTDLTAQPGAGATDLCGRVVPAPSLAEWRGPYVDRALLGSGLLSGNATIENTIRRDPVNLSGGLFGTLFVHVANTDRAVADRLERAFDGNANFGTGAIRWGETGTTGRGTLRFGIPVRGC